MRGCCGDVSRYWIDGDGLRDLLILIDCDCILRMACLNLGGNCTLDDRIVRHSSTKYTLIKYYESKCPHEEFKNKPLTDKQAKKARVGHKLISVGRFHCTLAFVCLSRLLSFFFTFDLSDPWA